MRAAVVAVIAVVLLGGGVARADVFDPDGWWLLSTRTIDSSDQARFAVPSYEGVIDELAVVVEEGSLEMHGLIVDLGEDEILRRFRHTFGDHSPTAIIDLAGNWLRIEGVELSLRNVAEGLVVRIYGRDTQRKVISPGTYTTAAWDPTGWTHLGRQELDGSKDGALEVRSTELFTRLAFVVHGSDLDISKLRAKVRGGTWKPKKTLEFREGKRTAVLAIADPSAISALTFDYTIVGGTKVRVEIYGLPGQVEPPEPEAPEAPQVAQTKPQPEEIAAWSSEGWTYLGEDDVDLVDDEVEVARENSTWSQIAIVVTGDDVDVKSVELALTGKGKKLQHEDIAQTFTAESRPRVIALTGKRRAIEKVRLSYTKHSLEAKTRVQVWAR